MFLKFINELNNKKINNLFAITGEIDLQGNVTAIGGLDLKILGGIRAGVKNFIFPQENEKDFKKFKDECKEKDESVIHNFVLTGFKICKSCRVSKTIFPI